MPETTTRPELTEPEYWKMFHTFPGQITEVNSTEKLCATAKALGIEFIPCDRYASNSFNMPQKNFIQNIDRLVTEGKIVCLFSSPEDAPPPHVDAPFKMRDHVAIYLTNTASSASDVWAIVKKSDVDALLRPIATAFRLRF